MKLKTSGSLTGSVVQGLVYIRVQDQLPAASFHNLPFLPELQWSVPGCRWIPHQPTASRDLGAECSMSQGLVPFYRQLLDHQCVLNVN
jgi:hypothetical protein